MRIDLPLCSFKDCRHNFDGNCRSKEIKEKCEFGIYKNIAEKQLENDGWIPCKDRLPEEHDSIFARFKGTEKWQRGMFEKTSSVVIVTIEDKAGNRAVTTAHTADGDWKIDKCFNSEVVAWMPFPEEYHGQMD